MVNVYSNPNSTFCRAKLEPNIENIRELKNFALLKWQQHRVAAGRDCPKDLSSGCKFGSLLALEIFGGKLRGNWFHHWVEVDNKVVDLSEDSQDVLCLKVGIVPDYAKSAALLDGSRQPPENVYTHDYCHMDRSNKKLYRTLKEWREGFVQQCVEEFWIQKESLNLNSYSHTNLKL